MSQIKPFEVNWNPADVEAVMDRIRAYPLAAAAGGSRRLGPTAAMGRGLRELCAHWTNRYNWRAAVADLNRFDQFTARVEDYDIISCTWLARRTASGR